MKAIWKYQLELTDKQVIEAPMNARALSVGLDPAGDLCVWMEVERDVFNHGKTFYIVGTGHPLPDEQFIEFIGSVKQDPFMWHVYEGKD